MNGNRFGLCPSAITLLTFSALCLSMAGCVERKLTIRSEPAAAQVTLDGEPIGETPVTVHFKQYGGREITLSKAQYFRHREIVRTKTPVYEWIGIDFFFEMIWPFNIVDEHEFSFRLKPLAGEEGAPPMNIEQLENRAQEMQERAETYSE